MAKETKQQMIEQLKKVDQDFLEQARIFDAKIKAVVKNSLTAKYFPKNYEVNTLPSKTIPDQSMSMRTILDRFARGLPINAYTQNIIEQDDPNLQGIDFRRLDLAEKEALSDANKQFIFEKKNELKMQQAAAAAKTLPDSDPAKALILP